VRSNCLICKRGPLRVVLDAGAQPVSNRYLTARDDAEETVAMVLLQCEACGLLQLEAPVPAQTIEPAYDWITYEEPEAHLDALADILAALPGIVPGSTAAGVSFKDDSTLARLERFGIATWRLDPERDLGATHLRPGYGVETVVDRFTSKAAERAMRDRAPADIVLARHILEHAADPGDFLAALHRITAPGGYLVVEVPDCSRALERLDYTVLWEEHALYFTPATFRQGFVFANFAIVRTDVYPYPFENSLVAVATRGAADLAAATAPAAIASERARAQAFGAGFRARREAVQERLRAVREHGRIALFGAGHLATTWVSLMGVSDAIEFVIDDNPHKRGLFLPGSRLPIVGSECLADETIALCLLSLNPISEETIVAKHAAFTARGGTFASIFPGSNRALI
jgi:SAM-dependent methyltransferase